MKRHILASGVMALAILGGQSLCAGEKAHTVGKEGLKVDGKIEEADAKHKFVPTPFKDSDVELPGKMHLVKVLAGKKYKVTMDSKDLDSVLVVKDEAGKQVAWDDDSGGGTTDTVAPPFFPSSRPQRSAAEWRAGTQGTGRGAVVREPR